MSLFSLVGGAGSGIASVGSTLARNSTGVNWGGIGSSIVNNSSLWGSLGSLASNYLSGRNSGGTTGSTGGSIFEAMLGGLGGAADAFLSKEAVEESGKQNRRTLDFKAALDDYYLQKNKVRKRAALDTYGQFSTMDRWAPGARPAPALDQPAKPGY